MRCLACDAALSEAMSRSVMPISGEHWDLCNKCLNIVKQVNNPLYTPDEEVSRVVPDDE